MKRPLLRKASRAFAVLMFVATASSGGIARADKLTDAEELFRRAKGLMGENKFKEACPLLEESEKLDPQMGTLLNLAICHESIGKIASAWGEFRAVEQQARLANREDRVKLAHDRAAKLESRLPRLKIVVPPDAKVSGLVIKVDGEPKGEPLWSGLAVDPDMHTVEASAPGKKTQSLKVKVDGEGALVPVTIPKLEDAPVVKPAGPDPSGAREREEEEKYAANRSRRTTGFVVGGIGLTAAAVGGTFGVLAIFANNDAPKQCPKPCIVGSNQAKAADQSTDRALLFANIANVVIPIGAIAAIVGGYMVLSAGPTSKPEASDTKKSRASTSSARLRIVPHVGGAGVGLSW